jgi:hypothetical protein
MSYYNRRGASYSKTRRLKAERLARSIYLLSLKRNLAMTDIEKGSIKLTDETLEKPKSYRVLSIDAWRYGDGWTWNDWRKMGEVTFIPTTKRKILKMLREEGFLSDASKGTVSVEDDQYNVVVFDRATGEPLIAIEYGNAD